MLLLGAFYFIFMSSKTLKNVGAGAAAGTACLAFNRGDRNASPHATPTWVNNFFYCCCYSFCWVHQSGAMKISDFFLAFKS